MGIVDEDWDELDEYADSTDSAETEALGVDDAETLSALDLGEDSEEVGLDTEVGLLRDLGDLSNLIDGDDDSTGDPRENDPLDGFDTDLGDEGEDESWTEDSEGAGDAWESEVGMDEEEAHEDDGGLEGVEDSLLDDFVADLPALSDDPDLEEGDTLVDDLGDDWLKDIGRAP